MPTLRPTHLAVGVLAAAVVSACAGERAQQTEEAEPISHTIQGDCQNVFSGEVCTWGTMVGDEVTEFGITVPLATVQGAPAEGEMTFPPVFVGVVPLPAAVATATGFDHVGLNWEPHGHPPGLFMVPHFDFHFYTIDSAAVMAIDCADVTKPSAVPAGYTLPDIEIPGMGTLVGLCVPTMGMHAMLETEVADTEPFGASMILGYDRQKPVFVEPMIAQAKLLEKRSFALDVPMVDGAAGVEWPKSFRAVYDEAAQSYRFVFSALE